MSRHLDEFLDSIEFEAIDEKLNKELLQKCKEKIKPSNQKFKRFKYLATIAALLILCIVPGQALFNQVIHWIPGLGAIESKEGEPIKALCVEPVRYESDDGFIEIRYAYVSGNYLNVHLISNYKFDEFQSKDDKMAMMDNNKFDQLMFIINGETFEKSFASFAANDRKMIGWYYVQVPESDHYDVEIGFPFLDESIQVPLINVEDITKPEYKTLAIDDMIVYANLESHEELVSVQLSVVGSKDKTFYDFKSHEDTVFKDKIRLIDGDGNQYDQSDLLDKEHYANPRQYFFKVPKEQQNNLMIELPYIMYTEKYYGLETMALNDKEHIDIDKVITVGRTDLTIESIEKVEALDIEVKDKYLFKIVTEAQSSSDEKVRSIYYRLTAESWFKEDVNSSMGIFPEWGLNSIRGESYTAYLPGRFKNLYFDVEVNKFIEGPFRIELD